MLHHRKPKLIQVACPTGEHWTPWQKLLIAKYTIELVSMNKFTYGESESKVLVWKQVSLLGKAVFDQDIIENMAFSL